MYCPRNTSCYREWESYSVTCISCVHWLWHGFIFQNNREKDSMGKKMLFNEITEAFLTLSRRLEDIDEEARCPLEWFVNLLCDKASPQASICYARNSSHEDVLLKRFPQLWQHYSSMTKEQCTREVIVGVKWWRMLLSCSTMGAWSNSKQGFQTTNEM